MPHRFWLALLLTVAAALPVRGAELTRRERGDLAIHSRAILKKYCGECHGEEKAVSFSVLNHAQLLSASHPVPFVSLKRSQVIELIEDGSMPPGGRNRPTEKDIETLKAWVDANAPSYPKAFDDQTTLRLMLDDWKQNPSVRYLSFAHLIR